MPRKEKKANLKNVLVSVSALAMLAAPLCSANGQVLKIVCKSAIDFGNHIASGCTKGTYVIRPSGGHSDKGCLIIQKTASPGFCKIRVNGAPATKSATIEFTTSSVKLTNGGTTVTLKDLRMRSRTSGTQSLTKIIATTSNLNSGGVKIDIGGSLYYNGKQTSGSYSGSAKVIVDFKT